MNPSVMHRHDSIFSWYKTFFSIFLVTIIATCNAGSRRRCWARGAAGRKASPRAVHPSTQLFVGIDYFIYQIIALTRTLIFFFMNISPCTLNLMRMWFAKIEYIINNKIIFFLQECIGVTAVQMAPFDDDWSSFKCTRCLSDASGRFDFKSCLARLQIGINKVMLSSFFLLRAQKASDVFC